MTTIPTQTDPTSSSDLEQILRALWRRLPLILGCVLVTAGIAFAISLAQSKEYSASASLLFRNPGYAEDLFGTSAAQINPSPTREAATNEKLVGLKVVAQRTARAMPDLSAEEVYDMVSVSSQGEAEVVAVTATSTDREQAKDVANTFARQFIAFRASADRSKLLQAKSLAEAEFQKLSPEQMNAARGQALSRSAEKLGVLASLQTGNAELVQPAETPTSPSSPKPLRNTLIGAVVGLLLGIAAAFLLERLDRKLRDPEEIRDAFGMPLLATVPESEAIVAAEPGAVAEPLPFAENEAFRMLRGSLRYFNVDADLRSVLVTSTEPEVGKSTVAWNLARIAASSSHTVLVETDLRNPSLARQHGLAPGPGLAELLTHQVDLDQAVQKKKLAVPSTNGGGDPTLNVIAAGMTPPNPGELIESQAMSEVLAQLISIYDFVVLDTAPVGVVADAFPLLSQVGGVIAVGRIGTSTRDSIHRLREQLGQLKAPVLGIVANGVPTRRGRFAYGYYGNYGNYAPKGPTPAKPTAATASSSAPSPE
jgi:capsular exopolysaccharide synthesis family protein